MVQQNPVGDGHSYDPLVGHRWYHRALRAGQRCAGSGSLWSVQAPGMEHLLAGGLGVLAVRGSGFRDSPRGGDQKAAGLHSVVDVPWSPDCLLYTSDAADDLLCVDLGGRRIIKQKKK